LKKKLFRVFELPLLRNARKRDKKSRKKRKKVSTALLVGAPRQPRTRESLKTPSKQIFHTQKTPILRALFVFTENQFSVKLAKTSFENQFFTEKIKTGMRLLTRFFGFCLFYRDLRCFSVRGLNVKHTKTNTPKNVSFPRFVIAFLDV
jgi:hypothetical protein